MACGYPGPEGVRGSNDSVVKYVCHGASSEPYELVNNIDGKVQGGGVVIGVIRIGGIINWGIGISSRV